MLQILWLILAVVAAATVTDRAASAEKRVALVIGNGKYTSGGQLANPPNDAGLVGAALAKAHFETVVAKTNLGIAEFRQTLRKFQAQANGAEVAFVYFAGHGIEANGSNWLIPTDAELSEDRDLEYEAIKADLVLQALQGAKVRILVLDACRNNPFGRGWRSASRDIARGLRPLETDDVLVLFAAAPGQTAADGDDANSPFARALAKRLPEAGLAVQLLGGNVRDDVLAATGGKQRPYVSASITGQPFYLVATDKPAAPASSDGKTVRSVADTLNEEEKKFFDSCVKLTPHLSRDSIVTRLAALIRAGTHRYGWKYEPPAPNLHQGDFDITSAEPLAGGILLLNYNYRWGRLFLMPVTLSGRSTSRGIVLGDSGESATRGFSPGDTGVDGASIQMQGMWIQESGNGCAQFYVNGATGEAAGRWRLVDDKGASFTSINRITRARAPDQVSGDANK